MAATKDKAGFMLTATIHSSLCTSGLLLGIALTTNAFSQSITVGSPQTAASLGQLSNAGVRQYYPDSTLDVYPVPGSSPLRYQFTAAGGDGLGSPLTIAGTLARPVSQGIAIPASPILGSDGTPIATTKYTYAGSGSIYRDPSGLWLQFYHAEHTPPGDSIGNFYSVLAIAVSSDQGQHWTDTGEIVTPSVSYKKWLAKVQANLTTFAEIEIGPGSYALRTVNGIPYFYLYFHDGYAPYPYQTNSFVMAVARAKVSDVIAAASQNKASLWTKYYNSDWSQPALGGLSTPVETGAPLADGGFSLAESQGNGELLMTVASGYTQPAGIFITESSDGVTWSPRTLVYTDPLNGQDGGHTVLYPTIVGKGADPRTVCNDFYIYWSHSLDAFVHVDIDRVPVHLN